MKLSQVLIAYFLVGALMWGGGVIDWADAGVADLIVTPGNNSVQTNSSTGGDVTGLDDPIRSSDSDVGLLTALLGLIAKLAGYLFWPVTVLLSVEAPAEIVVIAGGGMSVAFLGALMRFVSRQA